MNNFRNDLTRQFCGASSPNLPRRHNFPCILIRVNNHISPSKPPLVASNQFFRHWISSDFDWNACNVVIILGFAFASDLGHNNYLVAEIDVECRLHMQWCIRNVPTFHPLDLMEFWWDNWIKLPLNFWKFSRFWSLGPFLVFLGTNGRFWYLFFRIFALFGNY